MLTQRELTVHSLGECNVESPLNFSSPSHPREDHFVRDGTRIRVDIELSPETSRLHDLSFEKAGPRQRIFFDPANVRAAIVTCGGLSPGLNNVIRSIYYELTENYRVSSIIGVRNGYWGLNPKSNLEPITLTRGLVEPIHKLGGTFLGSSRGPQDPAVMVATLQNWGINVLFCLGGDGTQRGAEALQSVILQRELPIAVVGIPKTIDNDIPFVRQSFGYATALQKAAEVIRSAHVEARDAVNGIGLVKLMGRHAGFIAAGASVVSQEVNFTLVPEIPFAVEGQQGFLQALANRLRDRGHAVVVVAEGAGQHLFDAAQPRQDTSGNPIPEDIGDLLKQRIHAHFDRQGLAISLKYLDPSYYIRGVPANAYDRYLCDQLGRHAVHAAMAGKTGMLVGFEHNQFIHLPIAVVVGRTKQMDPSGDLWRAVLQVTRQPRW